MLLKQMQEINAQRAKRWHEKGEPWVLSDWSNAMAGECGEACNVVKKIRRADTGVAGSQDPPRTVLVNILATELADTVIYLMLVAEAEGIDLEQAIVEKFNAVSIREDFPQRMWH